MVLRRRVRLRWSWNFPTRIPGGTRVIKVQIGSALMKGSDRETQGTQGGLRDPGGCKYVMFR
eukprot:9473456-Pyramimonas_sp.AAC.2